MTKLVFRALALMICSDEGLTLEMSASLSLQGGNSTPIDLFDTNFLVFHLPTNATPQFL